MEDIIDRQQVEVQVIVHHLQQAVVRSHAALVVRIAETVVAVAIAVEAVVLVTLDGLAVDVDNIKLF